jgi:alpha/beta superfamily hydrolase
MTFSTLKNGSGLQGALAPRVRSVALRGPAGRLAGILNEGSSKARFAALVCHPHPLGGGTFHNKVVYHAMKAINDPQWGLGWPVLRFNFRGVGLSQGVHDGEADSEDVLAAIEWLESEYNLPLVVVGFSFGAAMALKACCAQSASGCTDASVRALALLGLPTQTNSRDLSCAFLQKCILPKLFLSGDCDGFAPVSQLSQVAAVAAEPKRLILIPGADHFFTGQLEPMQHALSSWLKEQLL